MRSSAAASIKAKTPCPYVNGQRLYLTDSHGREILVTIRHVFPITMACVMVVQFQTKIGFKIAILKLFDRRLGDNRLEHNHIYEHDAESEAAWLRFVENGRASILFDRLKLIRQSKQPIWLDKDKEDEDDEEDDEEDDGEDDGEEDDEEEDAEEDDGENDHEGNLVDDNNEEVNDVMDDQKPSPQPMEKWERLAEIEGKLQYIALAHYNSELRAYEKLEKLQGQYIPRLLFSVTYSFSALTQSQKYFIKKSGSEKYLHVPGILLQRIPGFCLDRITAQGLNRVQLEGIQQSAMETVRQINSLGVIHQDMQLRNGIAVRIDDNNFQVFILDFVNSLVRAEDTGRGNKTDPECFLSTLKNTDDPDDPEGFLYQLELTQNPDQIAVVMASKVWRETGYILQGCYFVPPRNKP